MVFAIAANSLGLWVRCCKVPSLRVEHCEELKHFLVLVVISQVLVLLQSKDYISDYFIYSLQITIYLIVYIFYSNIFIRNKTQQNTLFKKREREGEKKRLQYLNKPGKRCISHAFSGRSERALVRLDSENFSLFPFNMRNVINNVGKVWSIENFKN